MIIDCLKIASLKAEYIKEKVNLFKKNNIFPKLVVVQTSNDPASQKYINNKVKKGEELGIIVEIIKIINCNNEILIETINKINNDSTIHGVLVQLPLAKGLDITNIFNLINPNKDVDGLTLESVGNLWLGSNKNFVYPCTANGVIDILKSVPNYQIKGKHALIINRSNIVGKPLANLLLSENATVTIAHSHTINLEQLITSADIVISAVGIKNFLNKENLSPYHFVIDVGINVENNKIYGDCDLEQLKDYVQYITPVPNGVGRLTVINLFSNLIKLIENQVK